MIATLGQILELVGRLDDSPGEDTPRERFRRYLGQNLVDPGQARDYIEECLRTPNEQYSRALQDLVNLVGRSLGFEVTFGRYQGVQGQNNYDGYWRSPTGFHVVVEVKTSEVFPVNTDTLLHYVNQLISAEVISDPDSALGLYVIGRSDPNVRQLESRIMAERRSDQLRIISVDRRLSLAELMRGYDVVHEQALAVIRPSGPTIDRVVDLMTRLVREPPSQPEHEKGETQPQIVTVEPQAETVAVDGEVAYWLTPVASDEDGAAVQVIQTLVGHEHIYAFGQRTPGRSRIKPGDWICFYAGWDQATN